MSTFKYKILACLGLLFSSLASTAEPSASSREYQIKAAFLLNFTQFVQWPTSAFSDPSAPLCIGILGEDPFGPALDATVRGESAQAHKLSVHRAKRLEELSDCQLLFVSKSEKGRVSEILAKIDSKPVVTVSELADFARQGGTIDFYRDQNKVRFEINPGVAKQCGVTISSQLLGLGKIVGSSNRTTK